MKDWIRKAAVLIVVAAVLGGIVAASGVVPVTASSKHWRITRWILQFSKSRSVATHSLGIEPPKLDDQGLVQVGAGHYHIGCMPCHGSPEFAYLPVPHAMTPHPPNLAQTVPTWSAEELFYMVKHGIKFTGMPAWVAQERDDEVWSVVAFLQKLPELEPAEYQQMVLGTSASPIETQLQSDSEATLLIAQRCALCHGHDGAARHPDAFPRLTGQNAEYLKASLHAYRSSDRNSGIMEVAVSRLTDQQLNAVALHFANAQADAPPRPKPNPDMEQSIQRGAQIAQHGHTPTGVPACAECHGPDNARNPRYPRLAAQPAAYLVKQLTLFQENRRGGTEYADLMKPVVDGLTAAQIRDLALYYQSLAPESP